MVIVFNPPPVVSSLLLFVITVLFSTMAAKSVATPSADIADKGSVNGGTGLLQEVIVTAQLREQNKKNVPLSVSAFGKEELQNQQIYQLPDIAFSVPNMQISGGFGNAQPTYAIRGVTTADYNANQSSSIGVYLDEAYLGSVFVHGAQLFDIERVEVLRGPQGTLFGKNTTGGSINVFSRSPELSGGVSGNALLELGNYDQRRAELAVESPLVDNKLAARLAGYMLKREGYVDNKIGEDLGDADNWGVRVALLAALGSSSTAELKVSHVRHDGNGYGPRTEGRIPTANGFVDLAGYQRSGLGFHESEIDYVGGSELELDTARLRINSQLGEMELVSITSWYRADYLNGMDVDGSPFVMDHNPTEAKSEASSQDIRLQSSGAQLLSYVAGLYLSAETLGTSTSYTLYGSPNILQLDATTQPLGDLLTQFGQLAALMDIKRESQAAYAQVRWQPLERWGADIGLRYTRDTDSLQYANVSRYDYDGAPLGTWAPGNVTLGGLNLDSPFIPPGFLSPTDPGSYTDGAFTLDSLSPFSVQTNEWTGKLGIDFQVSGDLMVYASGSRGYRSGNFLGGAYYIDRERDGLYADPEYINAYELGSKLTALNNRLQLNTAAFYYDYKDMQFINIVGVTPALENAGSADIMGTELEIDYRPINSFTVRLAIGYLDSEYKELSLADADGNAVDLAGNQLISAPEWTVNAGADYRWWLPDGNELIATLDWRFQSEQYFSAYNDKAGYDKVKQDSYRVLNGRLAYRFNAKSSYPLEISAWGKNLLDEEYDTYAIGLVAALGSDMYQRGAPRSYGLGISFHL